MVPGLRESRPFLQALYGHVRSTASAQPPQYVELAAQLFTPAAALSHPWDPPSDRGAESPACLEVSHTLAVDLELVGEKSPQVGADGLETILLQSISCAATLQELIRHFGNPIWEFWHTFVLA